ncbi:MAG: hypothetical protein CV090_06220 [Nitrospira sp. WS238]|nr:hypothetical protein [Nitrospira sp. WS238]
MSKMFRRLIGQFAKAMDRDTVLPAFLEADKILEPTMDAHPVGQTRGSHETRTLGLGGQLLKNHIV